MAGCEGTDATLDGLQGEPIMTRQEHAISLFKAGFNCAQAVFTAYRDSDKLDESTALKLSTVLGAGVACRGTGMCGAAAGALLVLSLRHGRGDLASVAAKGVTYTKAQTFLQRFEQELGSTVCEHIIGINLGTPENLTAARARGLFEARCHPAVRVAADLLEELL